MYDRQFRGFSVFLGALVISLSLIACAPDGPAPGPSPSPAPLDQSGAADLIAGRLEVDPSQVEIQSMEPVDWPDACLGLPEPEEMCAEVITPGFGGVAEVDAQVYEFRTDLSGELLRLIPGAVLSARQVLAQQTNARLEQITTVEYEEMNWRDGCLELGGTDEMCLQAITPGYRVVLSYQGDTYVFHTDATGNAVRLAPIRQPL